MSTRLKLVEAPKPHEPSELCKVLLVPALEAMRIYSRMPARWLIRACESADGFVARGVGTEASWGETMAKPFGVTIIALLAYGLMHRSSSEGLGLAAGAATAAGGGRLPEQSDLADIARELLEPFYAPIPTEGAMAWLAPRMRIGWDDTKLPDLSKPAKPLKRCPCSICKDLRARARAARKVGAS